MTSTQSRADGGVKEHAPDVEYAPIRVACPVEGLYHHASALVPDITAMETVSRRATGRYAMSVRPLDVRAAHT